MLSWIRSKWHEYRSCQWSMERTMEEINSDLAELNKRAEGMSLADYELELESLSAEFHKAADEMERQIKALRNNNTKEV